MRLYCNALITYHILLHQSVLHGITVKSSFLARKQPPAAPSKRGRSESHQDCSGGDGWFCVLLASNLYHGLHWCRERGTHFAATGLAYLTYGFLAYLSSAINPVIYGAMNRHFRREYKAILKKVLCLQSYPCAEITAEVSGNENRRAREAGTSNVWWENWRHYIT